MFLIFGVFNIWPSSDGISLEQTLKRKGWVISTGLPSQGEVQQYLNETASSLKEACTNNS